MKHTIFFLRWSFHLLRKGYLGEAKAAFLEAFDRGRAEREAMKILSKSTKKNNRKY